MKRMGWSLRIRDQRFAYLIKNINAGSGYFDGPAKPSRAIVFSPHYDDETLGCGGTIIRMIKEGISVYLVFMTDGSTSHRHLMSAEELKRIRALEGREAASCLGIDPDHVILLEYPDGKLEKYSSEAGSKVQALLAALKPAEIFIPHAREPLLWSSDHFVTNRIVCEAAVMNAVSAVAWEYPIWYWYHWPWVGLDIRNTQQAGIILKNTIRYRAGTRAAGDFNCSISIKDELDQKRNALYRHKSQVSRLVQDDRWGTLHDIAEGDFIDMFFLGYELFRRTEISKQ
jgi:LmbE family N-acetylglucosaminyl deacetylase